MNELAQLLFIPLMCLGSYWLGYITKRQWENDPLCESGFTVMPTLLSTLFHVYVLIVLIRFCEKALSNYGA